MATLKLKGVPVMSIRPRTEIPRFKQLLNYPPTKPLLHVHRDVPASISAKRGRSVFDFPLDQLDPTDDPESFLRNYNRLHINALTMSDPAQVEEAMRWLTSAEPLLMDFIADQASVCTLFGDVETTELVDRSVPLSKMTISVATLMFVEDGGASFTLTFWSDVNIGRGAPLRFFTHALDHAKKLVFYNSNFDLQVAAKGDTAAVERWRSRTFDPYALLRDEFGFAVRLKLDILLLDNGLAGKVADGKAAVAMFKQARYADLEQYNKDDVRALKELISLRRIRLSNGKYTTTGTMQLREPRYPSDDPRTLVQGTAAWLQARRGLLTASIAGAALGLNGAFRSRDDVAAILHAQLNGNQIERGSQELEGGEARKAAMQRGERLEPIARRAFERLFGVDVEESGLHLYPRYPTMLAGSPDGIVREPDGDLSDTLVEFKVAREGATGMALTDSYLVQLQLLMACTATRNADFCVLVAFAGTNELVVTNVGRDDELVAVVESQLVDFFNEAKEDGDLYPRNSAAAAELRLALRVSRQNVVGEEKAFRVSLTS